MATNVHRGDAPKVAQVSRLKYVPEAGALTISLNGKTLGSWTEWAPSTLVNAWNSSLVPEYREIVASVVENDVLLTSRTPGLPFAVVASCDEIGQVTNSRQVITFINQPIGGSYRLIFRGEETVNISWNAGAATVLAALIGLASFQAGDIFVSEIEDGLQVDFGGRYAGFEADPLEVNFSDLRGGNASVTVESVREYAVGQNEVQRISVNNATGGTWALRLADETVIGSELAHDVSVGTLQAAFNTVLGVGQVEVTQPESYVFLVEFLGDLAEQPVGLLQVSYETLTPEQINDVWLIDTRWRFWNDPFPFPTDQGFLGFFSLQVPDQRIHSYDLLGSPVLFQEAMTAVLNEYFGSENYTVRKDAGGVDGVYEVELIGEFAGESGQPFVSMSWFPNVDDEEVGEIPTAAISPIQPAILGKPEKQLFTIPEAVSGQIRFRFGSVNTPVLNYDFNTGDANDLQSALNAVWGSGKVVVTGDRETGLVATYDQSLGNVPLPAIVVNTLVFSSGFAYSGDYEAIDYQDPVNILRVSVDSVPVSGTWRFKIDNTMGSIVTKTINWNASEIQIRSAVQSALADIGWPPGSVTVHVIGTLHQNMQTEIRMTNHSIDVVSAEDINLTIQANVTVETTQQFVRGQNEIQRLSIDYPASGGSFTLNWSGHSKTIPWSDFFSLRNYLNTIPGLNGNYRLTWLPRTNDSEYDQAYSIEFIGVYFEENAPDFSVTASNLQPARAGGGSAILQVAERIQVGQEAANVSALRMQAGSPEQGEQQRIQLMGEPHFGTWTMTIFGEQTNPLEYDINSSGGESALVDLPSIGTGNLTVNVDSEGGFLLEFAKTLGNVPLVEVSHELHNARAATEIDQPGGEQVCQIIQESRGPNHWDDPINWTQEHIPESGEDIVLETGRNHLQFGLVQSALFVVDLVKNQLVV